MNRGLLAIGILMSLAAPSAWAWNDQGHMMVAAIAWNHLDAATRERAAALLKLNPDYGEWIANIPAAQRDQVAFVRAATWADAIKTEAGYENDGNVPSGAESGRNIGYGDHLQHRYWHYIDIPLTTDGTAVVQPPVPNLQTQIERFTQAIRSADTSDNVKSFDLVWLEHLVGDAHQPLHATSRFSRSLPQGDRGGNLVALCYKPCRDELHAFWDDLLGTSKSVEEAISAAERLPAPSAAAAGISDDSVWLRESLEIAMQTVYASPIGDGPGPYTLDEHYRAVARSMAEERVALAGARLAILISANLK
jgi:hypothetical protein